MFLNNSKYFSEQNKSTMNPETILALLQTSASESEEDSDVSFTPYKIKTYFFFQLIFII